MVKVAVMLPADFADAAEFLADVRALEAAGAAVIGVEGGGEDAVLGAIAAVTYRVRILDPRGRGGGVLQKLSRGRMLAALPADETWVAMAVPADRPSWATMLRDQEAAGSHGVIVPWDPRLIDLLRNPEPEDRSDLLMSTG